MHGRVAVTDLALTSEALDGPLNRATVVGEFTDDSFIGTVGGTYEGITAQASGSVVGFLKRLTAPDGRRKRVVAVPTLSIKGDASLPSISNTMKAVRLKAMLERLPVISPYVRGQILGTTGRLSRISFEVLGRSDRPTVALAGHIDSFDTFGFEAGDGELRLLLANQMLTADLRSTLQGGQFSVRTNILLGKSGAFDVEAHARQVELGALHRYVKRKIRGRADLDLTLQGRVGRTPAISAQVRGTDVFVNDQMLHSVYGRAGTVGQNLVIQQLRVDDPKGLALITGSMNLRSQRLQLLVAGDNLDLHTLIALGQTENELYQQRRKAVTSTVRSAGTTVSNGTAVSKGTGRGSGGTDGLGVRAGVTQDAEAKLAFTDINSVNGLAFLRGQIVGTLGNPEVAGRLSVFGLQSGKAELDRVITDFSASKDAVVIAKGTAERFPGKVSFAGSVTDPIGANPYVRLRAQAQNLDIPDILRLAGWNPALNTGSKSGLSGAGAGYIVLGSVSTGPVELQGNYKSLSLSGPVSVTGNGISVNGLPIDGLVVTVGMDRGDIEILDAHANVAGGSLVVEGRIDDALDAARRGMDLTVRGTGLNSERLTSALPSGQLPLNVSGTVDFATTLRGRPTDPTATVDFKGRNLLLTDDGGGVYDIGELGAQGVYEHGRLLVDQARLSTMPAGTATGSDGTLTLHRFAYDIGSKEVSGTAEWQALGLQRLRELFEKSPLASQPPGQSVAETLHTLVRPLAGSISGRAILGGKIDAPKADLSWSSSGVGIEDHLISSFTGSAEFDRGQIRIPSRSMPDRIVQLRSADLDLDVSRVDADFNFDFNSNGGPLYADMRISRLSLDALQHFYSVNPPDQPNLKEDERKSRQQIASALAGLSGSGTATIQVTGTTRSPIVEASVNLRDITYRQPGSPDAQVINRIDLAHLTVQEGKIDTDEIQVLKTGTDPITGQEMRFNANAHGNLDFSWKPPYIRRDARLDVQASIPEQPLAILGLFKRDLNVTSDGKFALTAHLFNTLNNIRIGGSLTVNADRLQLGTSKTGLNQTGLRDLHGELGFLNDRIKVNYFTAKTQIFGSGGKKADPKKTGSLIELKGSLALQEGVESDGITLIADKLVVEESPLPGATNGSVREGEVAANVTVSGSVANPLISGTVRLDKAFATPPSTFGGSGGAPPVPFIDPRFELTVILGDKVRVVNPQLNARINGKILITGPLFVDSRGNRLPTFTSALGTGANGSSANGASGGGSGVATTPDIHLGIRAQGTLTIPEGQLRLPTARFTILPQSKVTVSYPAPDASANGIPTLGLDLDVHARTRLTANSIAGMRKLYTITVTARGPISGATVDPLTGDSRLALNYVTDPNDLATSQAALQQRLAGVLGGDAIGQFGRNPGQVLAQELSNVFNGSVIPGVFDTVARATGFDELQVSYDPIQRFNLILSRQIAGPFYLTYNRTLGTIPEQYTLKLSVRFRDRYQLSYEQNELNEQRTLVEGVWRF